jgi:hypothetical protein
VPEKTGTRASAKYYQLHYTHMIQYVKRINASSKMEMVGLLDLTGRPDGRGASLARWTEGRESASGREAWQPGLPTIERG